MKVSGTFDGPFLAIPKWAVHQAQKNPSALQVLCALVDHMDLRSKCATVTIRQLVEDTDTSPATVRRSLKWLESEGIVAVDKSVNNPNTYRINYEVGVSPMTGGAIMGDSPPLSPMTGGAIMGDTPKQPKKRVLPGDLQNSIEVYRESNKEKEKNVCDDGSDMILGSDPTEQRTPAPVKKKVRSTAIKPLVDSFCYHRSRVMTATYTPAQLQILRACFRRMLNNGLTPQTIHQMIDSFLSDTRFESYDNPVNAFASNKIQKLLLKRVTAEVTTDDPVLSLMANDFVREGQDLPWDSSSDELLRKTTTRHALEALFRYPELVAALAAHWRGDFYNSDFIDALHALDDLVKVGLGTLSTSKADLVEKLPMLQIPQDLLSGSVRPSAGTIKEAIYHSRRAAHA